MSAAQVVEWAWQSPYERSAARLPAGHWWSRDKRSLEALRRHVESSAGWASGWRIALRLGNGQIVFADKKREQS